MASRLYKEYLKLFEHWPLDITKRGGRDFAEYLRELTRAQFVSNNKFTIEEEETLKKNLASLKRLSEDIYNKKYPRTFQTSASGLNDSSDDVTMIDMTYGDGNHTRLILENIGNVKVICLDRDKESFEKAKTLAANDPRLVPVYGKFSDLPNILKNMNNNFNSIDGIIMDVGISDSQANSTRGFKPDSNSLLDMRMSQEGITGYQVLSAIDEVSLAKILKTYGEEKRSRQIARAIIETRYTFKKLERTRDLNELVASVVGTEVRVDPRKHGSEHVAQKVYNGLRRFVNNELNELNYAMIIAEKYLKPEGLLLTKCNSIVEDKIVKRHLTGNVIEHCANDLALKFVNHNLTVNPLDMSSLTTSPWTILDKIIPSDSDLKLRVAMKKESNKANVSQ
ncbi:hypothetical protein M8J77_013272 [Diaphorina citri]|nr:hypothetical protein M8J77_013272 [Diaphorina citri]